jgi:acetyl-CoA synthetase
MDTPDTDRVVYEPSRRFVESTNVYEFMQAHGIDDYDDLRRRTSTRIDGEPESGVAWFWDELVDYLGIDFDEPYDAVRDDTDGPQFTRWYPGGKLNVAHNVVDRHAAPDAAARNAVALVWEGEGGEVRRRTFHDLYRESNRVANALTERGVGVGDTVALYMPMVTEVVPILYGCFKVGAIAVPVFSGFGVDATATRLADADASVLFTADGFSRRGSRITLKGDADDGIAAAEADGADVEHVVVYRRFDDSTAADGTVPWTPGRDEWYDEAVGGADPEFDTVPLPSDAESMLLYSSGTTGMPKGIVHTHAGAQMQCAKEVYFGFDHKPGDRFFWLSDIGWMMGPWTLIGNHTFGGTVFMYEGAPDYPDNERLPAMIDRHSLSVFGVSPTAIRALRRGGLDPRADYDLSSLRLLGSTGEPWDPESWTYFYREFGGGEAPIINISGGTEICGCFLMPLPGEPLKPCTLGGPGLGMSVDVVDGDGVSIVDTNERGYLVARDSCPSTTKSLWSGDDRYLEEYWSRFDDVWNHGDWAQQDADGFWFLHGRADDALNVAGRKVGPAEIEGVLMEHDAVNQAVTVGVPDDTTGTAVVAYVVLEPEAAANDDLREDLRTLVGEEQGKPFRPRELLFVDAFPKTQSGKIIRRAVAAVHRGEDPGDLSSMENPEALEALREAT